MCTRAWAAKISSCISRVVPGGTVLLIITSWPSATCGATAEQAARIWLRSASKSSDSGVPTVISTARVPFAAAGSVEPVSRPAATPSATSASSPGSGIGQVPRFSAAIISALVSMPTTLIPFEASTAAITLPM